MSESPMDLLTEVRDRVVGLSDRLNDWLGGPATPDAQESPLPGTGQDAAMDAAAATDSPSASEPAPRTPRADSAAAIPLVAKQPESSTTERLERIADRLSAALSTAPTPATPPRVPREMAAGQMPQRMAAAPSPPEPVRLFAPRASLPDVPPALAERPRETGSGIPQPAVALAARVPEVPRLQAERVPEVRVPLSAAVPQLPESLRPTLDRRSVPEVPAPVRHMDAPAVASLLGNFTGRPMAGSQASPLLASIADAGRRVYGGAGPMMGGGMGGVDASGRPAGLTALGERMFRMLEQILEAVKSQKGDGEPGALGDVHRRVVSGPGPGGYDVDAAEGYAAGASPSMNASNTGGIRGAGGTGFGSVHGSRARADYYEHGHKTP